jgi:hypothetical protein
MDRMDIIRRFLPLKKDEFTETSGFQNIHLLVSMRFPRK